MTVSRCPNCPQICPDELWMTLDESAWLREFQGECHRGQSPGELWMTLDEPAWLRESQGECHQWSEIFSHPRQSVCNTL